MNWFEKLMDKFKGDKFVLIIMLMLMMISALCIFSSTSQLREVLNGTQTRTGVLIGQLYTIGMGLILVTIVYFFNMKWLRFCARCGFAVSFILLVFLVTKAHLGPIRAASINGAWRVIAVGPLQIHVYEFVKVAMIMYLAWAMDTYNNGDFMLTRFLSSLSPKLEKLSSKTASLWICVYIPMGLVFAMVAMGSVTSSLFISAVMFVTVIIGGLGAKELIRLMLLGVTAFALVFVSYKVFDIKAFSRLETAKSRLESFDDKVDKFLNTKSKSKEYYDALADIEQVYGAKIAIKQGGLLGKGAGNSTQRYKVSVMYEDFMFSFVVEEYGLAGALILLILYASLIVRGSFISRRCSDSFGKIVVAGLVLLICGQAYLHMYVNTGLAPMTGQTLPLLSHGRFAFCMFSLAFGIILCISKNATIAAETISEQEETE